VLVFRSRGSVDKCRSMLSLDVFLQFTTDAELRQTVSTDVWSERPTARVAEHVFTEMLGAREGFRTRRAGVRLVAVVQLDVATEVPDTCKENAADAALELHHAVDITHVVWF